MLTYDDSTAAGTVRWHSVLSGIDEGVMSEYITIIKEVSGKDICKMAVEELDGYKHGALIAEEKAKG